MRAKKKKKGKKERRSHWYLDSVRDILWVKVRSRKSYVAKLRSPCITACVSNINETWFNFSFQIESIAAMTLHITTLPQQGLSLYHCECPWWSRRLSGTSKTGTKGHSQLVLLRRARSIYTGTSHLALLNYQRCHSQLCHLDTGLLRLLCYRIHPEGVCCNYDLPVKRNRSVP